MGRSEATPRLGAQPTGIMVGLASLLSVLLLGLHGCAGGPDIAGVPQSADHGGFYTEDGTTGGREKRSRVTDGDLSDAGIDDEDDEEEDEEDERANQSECRFFQDSGQLAFTEKPRGVDKDTNIKHMPPAQYPMPVHEHFDGEWQGDNYVIYVQVDILLSYNVHKVPYEARFRPVMEGMDIDPAYERRIYKVTIVSASSSFCTTRYELAQ